MRTFVDLAKRKRLNEEKAKALRAKHVGKLQRKIIKYFDRVAGFEAGWLKKVRFEIYFKGLLWQIIESLKCNVKYERAARAI